MGTRGAYGFRINSSDKVSYNHWDSYPSGLGSVILEYVKKTPIDKMKEVAERIVLIDDSIPPTPEQIEECKYWTDLGVSNKSTSDWYCLIRQAQGNLDAYNDGLRYMSGASEFLLDSLFCEYAYIINLDTNMVEVYVGFNKATSKRGRYASLQNEEYKKSEDPYYGILLFQEIPIKDVKKIGDVTAYCKAMEEAMDKPKDAWPKIKGKRKPKSKVEDVELKEALV